MSERQYTTIITVVGRPNAGKSTLINALVKKKALITSRRPQTTRQRIHAVHTQGNYQLVCIDTPGINPSGKNNRIHQPNKMARQAISPDTDLVLLLLDGLNWGLAEDNLLLHLKALAKEIACIAVINKMDRYKHQQAKVLQFIQQTSTYHPFHEIVPICARRLSDIRYLEGLLGQYVVPRQFIYPKKQWMVQDRSSYVSELIREKILRRFNQEVPYSAQVMVNQYSRRGDKTYIKATIHVERKSHKKIIIGHGGKAIRAIGQQARQLLEKQMNAPVHIQLWVKVGRFSRLNQLLPEPGYR